LIAAMVQNCVLAA